ncbi:thiamine diphosphokinase [Weissella diestrammenae]|uniref:Thiamine diphosphokinase n=1 Tax=Weissella diestrammenae TaxID=1162633 RepID=A0A7G9T7R0_9LACO|nr:thiamine diphosphokinase [Weissella diestrammenae]QNN76135.1 thiamine diphosphokinase [Weissella diestrammenae]
MPIMRLLVGGPKSEWPDELKNGQLKGPWAAADRGALRLLKMNITPVLALGDFDSIQTNERQAVLNQLTNFIAKTDQIQTDTQALLTAVESQYAPDIIEIYGATGGRIDHLLSNLFIFTQAHFKKIASKVKIIDRSNVITFYLPGNHVIHKLSDMKYLGFMVLEPTKELVLVDEKYPLHWSGNPMSWSSNEFMGDTNHFSFESGMIAVIQSKDAENGDLSQQKNDVK